MSKDEEVTTQLLTRSEAATYLGVSPQTLANWACTKSQTLPLVRVGRSVRYRLRDLEAWLDGQTVRPVSSIEAAIEDSQRRNQL